MKKLLVLFIFTVGFLVFIGSDRANAQTCPTIPSNTGRVTLSATTTAGTFRVWSRMKAADGTNNSFYVQFDSNCPVLVGNNSSIPTSWTWVDYINGNSANKFDVTLTAGTHVVTIIGNESGVGVDKLLMTKNLTCVPTGISGDNCPAELPSISPSPDNTSPIISAISASNVSPNQVTINWTLSEYGSGQVEYGASTSYGKLSNLQTCCTYNYHIQTISGLSPNTTYHYRVKSADAVGNAAVSGDCTFTTPSSGTVSSVVCSSTPASILTPTKTPTSTPTPTVTPTKTPTPTPIPTLTPTPTKAPIPTPTDNGGPVISNPRVTDVTSSSVKVRWELNELASGQVDYGTTSSYGQKTTFQSCCTYNYHIQSISGLTANTTYHYRITSIDEVGNTATTRDCVFKTGGTATQTCSATITNTAPPTLKLNLSPNADSYVVNTSPNSNYGARSVLQTDLNPAFSSYLKFNLTPLAGKTIVKATLKIKVIGSSSYTQTLRMSENTSWTESGLTYNNRPSFSSTIISFGAKIANSVIDLNVTSQVNSKKGGNLTLGITSGGDDRASYYSKEATSGNKPVLIVEYK